MTKQYNDLIELMQKCHEKAFKLSQIDKDHPTIQVATATGVLGNPGDELTPFIRHFAPQTRDPSKPSMSDLFTAYQKFLEELDAALPE